MFVCLATADLHAAGWNSRQIKAAEGCCLRKLRRGRYVVAAHCSHPEHRFIADIAAAPETDLPLETTGMRKRAEDLRILVRSFVEELPPDAVFSHRSALVVHGLPIPLIDDDEIFAEAISPRSGIRMTDLLIRRRQLPDESTEIILGLRVTTLLQTLLDIARDYPLDFAVAVADAAVRQSRVSVDEIRAYFEAHPVRTGRRRVASVLENIDGRRETVAESICAMRFVEYSIPGFEPQLEVLDSQGTFLARADFGNRRVKVLAEFDGAAKYFQDGDDPRRAFETERQREYKLRNEGYMVFRIRWPDLFTPEVFLKIKETVRKREVAFADRAQTRA